MVEKMTIDNADSFKDEKMPNTVLTTVATVEVDKLGTDSEIARIVSPGGKDVKITGEMDEAIQLALESHPIDISEEADAKLLRKIDLYLVPFFAFLYAVQYMDKVTNSFASIMGLKTDLNMVGNMYSWCGTSFYLGYLAFVFPMSYLVQVLPTAKVCGAFICIWGLINAVNCTPKYAGFIALRTLLGGLESVVTPTMVICNSQYWKTSEQFLRTTIWFSATSFGTMLGYSIAYGLYIHQDSYSIDGWKLCFIVFGVMTIFLGIVFIFHVPDTPAGAWFLSHEEKLMVVERIRANNQGFGSRVFKMHQLKECLLDYRVWLIFLFGIADEIPNGGLTNFSAIIFNEDFLYSTKKSLLMNLPPGAVGWIGCLTFASIYSTGVIKHRTPISIAALTVALIGSCLLAFCESSPTARLAGYYIMQISPLGMIGCLSMYSSNIAGHTKKVTGNAFYLVGYCTGNIIGPQTFRDNQAPHYAGAKAAIVTCYAVSIVILCILYASYYFDNRRRDKLAKEDGYQEVVIENQEFADLTDRENPHFRYTL